MKNSRGNHRADKTLMAKNKRVVSQTVTTAACRVRLKAFYGACRRVR